MAQSKSFFGLRTGSTKSLTFQIYRGQQITKDRVTRVSNPKSDAQMQQRLLIPMVAQCRSMLSGLIDHSFEGIPYGYKSLQHFSKLNLRKGALSVTQYVPKGAKEPGVADYIISTGSLHEIACSDNGPLGAHRMYTPNHLEIPVMANHAEMTKGDPIPSDWLDAFLAANPLLRKGDQLTCLELVEDGSYTIGDFSGTNKKFVISRLILDPANASFSDFKFVEVYAMHALFSNGTMTICPFVTADRARLQNFLFTSLDVHNNDVPVYGIAVILSRLVNNEWKRSFSRLGGDFYDFVSNNFDQVLPTYIKSGSASSKYLNGGSEGAGIQG